MAVSAPKTLKRVQFLGDTLAQLKKFPEEVRREIGQAIYEAQRGESHTSTKRMKGINAVEIVADYDTDTYRGVYTTRFSNTIYILHCFQKKSRRGTETPREHVSLIKSRLKQAEKHYGQTQKETDNE
jgi:phage-related protein